ncbi:MAG TPA: tyrosine--tRNA ligase [Bacteroidota bacterium]|nr:tyrosine--tRNA ligase [Bacteroidota bacterium]
MEKFYSELEWRGLIHSKTRDVEKHLAEEKITGYIGFDPTASSLHVGSLLPIMGLVHFQRAGHSPIAIAGGGTGMIGDPSGKTQERKLLTTEEIESNLESIKKQLEPFLDFKVRANPARLINNADWLTKLSMMEFLRDYGKHFSVNEMLAKDSVKNRIEQEQGISFTEFSYSLLQSIDYLQVFDRFHCTIQMGGSDQWGNIVAGADLIRRMRGAEVHALVFPLITTSSGVKFGKTESGTVWLDEERTSPYKFWQFWYNTDDQDVVKYLKYFTLLTHSEIEELEASVRSAPQERRAQTKLASEVTERLHGSSAAQKALAARDILFGTGDIRRAGEKDLLDIFSDVPSVELARDELSGAGTPLLDVLVASGAVKSKGDARRAIQSGGIYLNNDRVTDENKKISVSDSLHGKFFVLRRGNKNYFLVKLR